MRVIAWDTETALIRPALLAPPLVCVTWQEPGQGAQIEHVSTVEPRLRAWLEDPTAILVGHNVAYDLAVVSERFPHLRDLVFAAYEADRVTDTKLRQQLLDLAAGVYRGRFGEKGRWIKYGYSLEDLAKRCAGMQLAKDGWRLSYAEFLDTPLAQWPARAVEVQTAARAIMAEIEVIADPDDKEAKKRIEGLREMIASDPSRCTSYPLDDARATLAVYQAQEKHAAYLDDQYRQARAAWALHLSSAWGVRTDAPAVEKLEAETAARLAELEDELRSIGFVREDGSRDTKAVKARMISICALHKIPIRRTDAHLKCEEGDACTEHVSLDKDACDATDDEPLELYALLSTTKKVLSNDVKMLLGGASYPIHPRYDMAETGRTTCSPNIQNVRRLPGIRECIVPRPGKVFAQADFPQLELYALAQCCVSWLGASKLGDALNAGLDPHMAMAAQILGITYDEAAKNKKRSDVDNARQTAKVANFGFPGGLGIEKLTLFARKTYGVELTVAAARTLKEQWFTAWPEMPHYFARVNALCDNDSGRAFVETLFTKRFRGGASYCAACNNGFQALGVDCAKRAMWLVARAQYTDRRSPLFDSRTVAFVHDELIVEVDDAPSAHGGAVELARLMCEGANTYLPDVPIPPSRMDPLLMRRWSKKACAAFDASGRLVPWAEAA